MTIFGLGPNPEMESVRQGIQDFIVEQNEKPREEGTYRIEAPLEHSPIPWGQSIITNDVQFLLGKSAELFLMELGYRAAWRLGCETFDGLLRRAVREGKQKCVDEGHDWYEPERPSECAYAKKVGYTKSCGRCGHCDSDQCQCSFCRPKSKLRSVK